MKRAILSGLALIALAACGNKDKRPEREIEDSADGARSAVAAPGAPEFGAFGVDLSAIDSAIDPGDDFNAYANGAWEKSFRLPDGYSSYGALTMVADRVDARMKAIVDGLLKARPTPDSPEQKIRDFYASYVDVGAINEKGLAPLAADFAAIDAVSTPEAAAALFLRPSPSMTTPIEVQIDLDAKRPDRYAVYLTQAGLGMPNRDFYVDERFADKRARYRDYIAATLRRADFAEPEAAAERIVTLETEIARAHWDPAKRRNRTLAYNPKTFEQLEAYAPSLPWRAMLDAAGLGGVSEVILREDDALRATADLIATTPVAALKEYLKFHLINSNADVLPAPFDDAKRGFFGGGLQGGSARSDRRERAVAALDAALGDAVGRIYVERHFPLQSKAAVEAIVANLRAALGKRLDEPGWMEEETRIKAAEKLSKLAAKIGYPDRWRDYSGLEILAGDAYGNAKRAREFEWNLNVAQLGRPIDRGEWSVRPYTLDAFYDPAFNEIVFPAAILDAPFFDPNADGAVNYGAIGAVIGHEIAHGYDAQGRKTDGDGVLRDWWTPSDADRYYERAQELGAQYSAHEGIEGLAPDADAAIGENIGDLCGLAIAFDAYRLSLKGAEASAIDGVTGDQRFFLAWAQIWRRVAREELPGDEFPSGPHAPAQYRVNGVVRNMDVWYEAFGVTPDDDLWIAPEDRVQIW
jgi:predicted metalloendopeptidase